MSKRVFILSNPHIDIPQIAEYVVAEQGLSTLSFWNGDKMIMGGEPDVLPQHFLSYYFAYSESLGGAQKLRVEFLQRRIDEAQKEVLQAQAKADKWINVMNQLNVMEGGAK